MYLKNSSDKNFMFNLIAPFYGLYYESQKTRYRAALGNIKNMPGMSGCSTILDVGCGTGALCSVLAENGYAVTGIDPARKMLETAVKKTGNSGIAFIQADILAGLPFEDKSFDVCTASYVAHGLKAPERKIMFAEMNRIAKYFVILYDYNTEGSNLTSFMEWLERSDYKIFIRSVKQELESVFGNIKIAVAGIHESWYICTPKNTPRK